MIYEGYDSSVRVDTIDAAVISVTYYYFYSSTSSSSVRHYVSLSGNVVRTLLLDGTEHVIFCAFYLANLANLANLTK